MAINNTTLVAALFAAAVTVAASQPAAARDSKDPRDIFVATSRTVAPGASLNHNVSVTQSGPRNAVTRMPR